MTYRSNTELPNAVKTALPAPAQDLYRSAFNHAWQIYGSPTMPKTSPREATAHKVAWAAVRRRFEQVGDAWVAKH